MENSTINKKFTRPKLEYLDGLRGFSALIIALYHAQLFTGHGVKTSDLIVFLKPFSILLSYGHLAVPVFIVLSGYSLTIPVALNQPPKINGGFVSYIGRRAKRILPPYYFALLFFIVLIKAIPILQTFNYTAWDSKIPISWQSIITHIFLIHNFKGTWMFKIDGPLWSVATEWQIYFLFPILIYIWNKYNLLTATLIAVTLGIISAELLVPATNMSSWFIGLFGLGMLAANISFSKELKWSKLINTNNYQKIFYLGALMLIILLVAVNIFIKSISIAETLIGSFIALMLIYFTFIENGHLYKPIFLRILDSRMFRALGIFSYSIYLIHSPFLGLINLLTLKLPISISCRWLLMEIIAVPISVLISYIFYLLIEKRFQSKLIKQKNPLN
jgi:peptidoglycan/LPS O-acetylase OafA/YrhL